MSLVMSLCVSLLSLSMSLPMSLVSLGMPDRAGRTRNMSHYAQNPSTILTLQVGSLQLHSARTGQAGDRP